MESKYPFNNGPDQIKPSDGLCTSKAEGCVRLKIPETGKAIETTRPISVPGLLHRTALRFPDAVALAHKTVDGSWKKITYKEYEEQVRICAKAFLHLGLERYHSVCILGFNSPKWFMSHLGAIFAGGFSAGVYTTNSSEACFHCADSSSANIIVVEDSMQLEKIQKIRSQLPHLKAVVQYEGKPSSPDVISWEQLIEIGREQSDDKLEATLKGIAINQCCTLVYTSGTVGNPKAVMLSHDNLTWNALTVCESLQVEPAKECVVSFLPLSHIAAQIVDIMISMTAGAAVYFADKNALKGSLIDTLKEVQPTRFLAVPRVWEKIHEKLTEIGTQNGSVKKAIATWAKWHGLQHNLQKMNGAKSNLGWGYKLAHFLVLQRIRQALGLHRSKTFFTGAAPLSPDIQKYFLSIDMPLMETFGMSECAGCHTLCTDYAFGVDTVGSTLPGLRTKLHEADERGHGEICMYGRNVFMGYLNEPAKTAEALDAEGWLHSGDIGYQDQHGFVYVTGRLKELLITAGGENVPPVPIEQNVKHELPHVSNAMLIGDKRKYLTMLLTLKTDVDFETGAPLDTLTNETKEWLKELECPADTVTDVLKAGPDSRLLNAIQQGVDRVNQKATSNAQRIQKIAILPDDFSIHTGELGPTLKLKRQTVISKYEDIIEHLYR